MKKIIVFCLLAFFFLVGTFLYQSVVFNDGKLHVIFCDVGQGDAILIKTPKNKLILADGGPDRIVLDCLSRHIPFWERELDLVLLSHPHADHFVGFFHVFERYTTLSFATERLSNNTGEFSELGKLLTSKKIPQREVFAGDLWKIGDGVSVKVVAPTQKYLESTSPGGQIGESKEFASLIVRVSYEDFDVLLTGDSQIEGMTEALEFLQKPIEVLQAPHHGSASGLDEHILTKLQPEIAVISVGKNRYGHPTKKILNLFSQQEIKILRTDQMGDIELVSDGKKWKVVRN